MATQKTDTKFTSKALCDIYRGKRVKITSYKDNEAVYGTETGVCVNFHLRNGMDKFDLELRSGNLIGITPTKLSGTTLECTVDSFVVKRRTVELV